MSSKVTHSLYSSFMRYGFLTRLRGSSNFSQKRCIRTQNQDYEESSSRRLELSQASSMLDVGIRPIFSEEHDMFRETARKFFREVMAPQYVRWEKQGYIDKEYWEMLADAGLVGVTMPPEVGGAGGDFKMAMVWQEEQTYSGVAGGFTMHNDVIMPYLLKFGTKEQKDKYFPEMMQAKRIGALAMTEPSAGSDVQNIRTYAVRDGDDWILNGSKVFITNGYLAGLVVVATLTDLDIKNKAHGITLFLVEEGMPGFKKGRILDKIGLHAQDTAELFFEDVRLPSSAILGGPDQLNKGFYVLMDQLPRERMLFANWCQAASEVSFELARDYVRGREAFGTTISKLQTIQHLLAELKTRICVCRSFVDKAIQMCDEGRLDSNTAAMAKYWATDMSVGVTSECLQLHGGWGYMWKYPIARYFTEVRVGPIAGGSNEIMRELIARDIVQD